MSEYGKDKRIYARFEVGAEATLKHGSKSFKVTVNDVSLGGVQLLSPDALPTEDTVLLVPKPTKGELKLNGRVRYCAKGDTGAFISGYKFEPRTLEERVAIAEFVREIFENSWEALAS